MRPVNLYDAKGEHVASVHVKPDVNLNGIVLWNSKYYRFATPDRADEIPVYVANEFHVVKPSA